MKLKLTSAFCRDITCTPGKRKEVHRCTECIGFGIEVRASGNKTYWLYYTNAAGKAAQIKIGGYTDVPFEAAKRKAKELRSQVVLGGDPASDKAQRKVVPRYAELARLHIEHAEAHLRSHANIELTHRRYLIPRFGKLAIDAITPQAIEKFLAELRETLAPATVDKVRVIMHRSYQLAAKWDMPGAERNPVTAVARPRYDNRREKFLSTAESKLLVKACGESENPMLKPIVQLLLATGARKREILTAKWDHVDRERGSLLFPMTKNGRSRRIPLSKAALDVIDDLPRLCDYLVPNPATLLPYDNLKRSWATACRRLAFRGCVSTIFGTRQ